MPVQITYEQYLEEKKQGTGYSDCIISFPSTNGKECLLVRDEIYLFQKEEIGCHEWMDVCNRMREELYDCYNYRLNQ